MIPGLTKNGCNMKKQYFLVAYDSEQHYELITAYHRIEKKKDALYKFTARAPP